MESQLLQAEERSQSGKSAARQLRSRSRLPGILYGQKKEPTPLSVSAKSLLSVLSTDYKKNVLIELELKGKNEFVIIKDMQIHPVSRDPLHIDFYRVDLETPIEVRVPFVTVGQAKGVLAGGELNVVFRTIPILAKPNDVPASIEVDIRDLQIHDILRVKDLELREGIKVILDSERTLVAVAAERKEIAEEAAEEMEGPEGAVDESKAEGKAGDKGDKEQPSEG